MKQMIIDPKLQSILEHLKIAREEFNEVFIKMNANGIKLYDSTLKDFLTDIDSAITNTSYLVASKIEYDIHNRKTSKRI